MCFFKKHRKIHLFILRISIYGSVGITIQKHQGQYPVIFLSFKDVKCLSWQETFQKLVN